MRGNTKTRPVIIWPDGEREPIYRERWGWRWSGVFWPENGEGLAVRALGSCTWSSHLDSVREGVRAAGGELVREPNPYYREPVPDAWATFRDIMRTLN